MDKQFNPIGHDFINRNFNDRRITGQLGVPNSPEKGEEYRYKSKKEPVDPHANPKEDPFAPKHGPHDKPKDPGYGYREGGLGGVKPKPKGPKPSLPPLAKKK